MGIRERENVSLGAAETELGNQGHAEGQWATQRVWKKQKGRNTKGRALGDSRDVGG